MHVSTWKQSTRQLSPISQYSKFPKNQVVWCPGKNISCSQKILVLANNGSRLALITPITLEEEVTKANNDAKVISLVRNVKTARKVKTNYSVVTKASKILCKLSKK